MSVWAGRVTSLCGQAVSHFCLCGSVPLPSLKNSLLCMYPSGPDSCLTSSLMSTPNPQGRLRCLVPWASLIYSQTFIEPLLYIGRVVGALDTLVLKTNIVPALRVDSLREYSHHSSDHGGAYCRGNTGSSGRVWWGVVVEPRGIRKACWGTDVYAECWTMGRWPG